MFKPCPFCGSVNLESGGDDKIVAVRCRDCEATGPNHYGSRAEWNTRTEPQTAPDEPTVSDIELLRKCLTQAGEAAPPGIEELGAEFLPHARRVFRYVERLASRNAAPADAERLALVEENKRLRQIISGCAAALPNGAVCSPECSLDFMQHLPGEIAACYTRLRAGGWREDMENAPHGQRVLLGWYDWRDGAWCMEVGCASHGRRTYAGSSVSHHGSATHWMPLPSAPHTDKER